MPCSGRPQVHSSYCVTAEPRESDSEPPETETPTPLESHRMFSHQTALVSTFKQTSYFKTKRLASTGILIDVNISQRLSQTYTSCLINNPAEKYLEHSAILNY